MATAIDAIDAAAIAGTDPETFDMLIAPSNTDGNAIVRDAINALVTQTNAIQTAIDGLGIATGDLKQDTEEDIE